MRSFALRGGDAWYNYRMHFRSHVALVAAGSFLFAASHVFAHVTVQPKEVGIGAFQTFTVSVPSEREEATVRVRLVLPMGLTFVTPTVKSGWIIDVVRDENDTPVEIIWRGGRVPGHFRDDFSFSARVPAEPTELAWRAYQTYEGGAAVSWELGPNDAQPTKADGGPDFSAFGPYSHTAVVDDLIEASPTPILERPVTGSILGGIALAFSLIALAGKFVGKKTGSRSRS